MCVCMVSYQYNNIYFATLTVSIRVQLYSMCIDGHQATHEHDTHSDTTLYTPPLPVRYTRYTDTHIYILDSPAKSGLGNRHFTKIRMRGDLPTGLP